MRITAYAPALQSSVPSTRKKCLSLIEIGRRLSPYPFIARDALAEIVVSAATVETALATDPECVALRDAAEPAE